jgi:hypothetical protein
MENTKKRRHELILVFLSILANDNGAFFFPQKLADNGEMVSITSFTYHLSKYF